MTSSRPLLIKGTSSGFEMSVLKGMLLAFLLIIAPRCLAERIVLAPGGLTVPPGKSQIEFLAASRTLSENYEWVTVGLPDSLMDIEMELERQEFPGGKHHTISLQYSLFGNLFSDMAPAISLGVRDLLDEGSEGRAFYIVGTKTFRPQGSVGDVISKWHLHIGYGTSHIGGAYIGADAYLPYGLVGSTEYVARRLNTSLSLPVFKYVNVEGAILNGEVFYGASISIP
jgi:hypothetical protein